MLLRMAWRNLWRNPRRTAVVLTAISVGIAGCVLSMAINLGMVAGMVDTAIRSGLAHIQVHASGWDASPELEIRLLDGGAAVTSALDDVAEIESWAPRLRAQGLVASPRASVGVAIAGVDAARERGVSVAVQSLSEGDWLGEKNRVVLGYKLARRLDVEPGSKIVVSVQDLDGELTGRAFRVAGLVRAGTRDLDDGLVFMRIEDAQALLGMGDAISEIAIVTSDRARVALIQDKLEAILGAGREVRTWEQLEPLLVYMVDSFDSMAWIVYAAVFIAMAFGIANVLLMAVFERTREIGMMRAVGMSRARVVGMVVLESSFVTALGLVLGVVLAVLGVWLLADGIDISRWAGSLDEYGIEPVIRPALRGRDLVAPVIIGGVTALLSSLWPAVRAGASQAGRRPQTGLSDGSRKERRTRSSMIIEAIDVTKVYDTRGVETRALDGVSLGLEAGEFSALAGPSGSGKTTLLNLLGALDTPTSGKIQVAGVELSELSPAALSELRLRKLGFIFQSYNLIPVLTALENIEFVMELQDTPAAARRERALHMLERVELGGLGGKRPLEMSGGQQQRVAVARAIASKPSVVLADEPTANLDSDTARRLLELMSQLNREDGVTFLFSTHDPLVMEAARRIVRLRDGRVVEDEVKTQVGA